MKFKMMLIAGSLTLSPTLYADTLFTPTLWAKSPDMFACNLTNVGDARRTVQVRIISNGNILADSKKVELAPRHTADLTADGFKDGGPIYCEFAVDGIKEQFRGVAKLFRPPNGSDSVALPAQ